MKIIINIANSNKSVRFVNNKLKKKTKQLKLFEVLNKKSIFEIIKNEDDTISLKAFNNKFVSAQPNGLLECNRDRIDIWEKFTLVTPEGTNTDSEVVLLKTYHNKYIGTCNDDICLEARDSVFGRNNELNIKYIDEREVEKIKKEFRQKVRKDVGEGFRLTGVAIGALLKGTMLILSAMSDLKKCEVCDELVKDPHCEEHLKSKRHLIALSKKISKRELILPKQEQSQQIVVHVNPTINPVFNNNK